MKGRGVLYFIGIDPGANGGFACVSEDGTEFETRPFDGGDFIDFANTLKRKAQQLSAIKESWEDEIFATIEKVGAMPKQGVVSMFNFGKNVGYIEGVLDTVGIEFNSVTPQEWKKEFGLISKKGTVSKEKKQASIDKCKELFPAVSLRKTSRCTTDSDGIAEALLIAEYCRRKFGKS